MFSSIKARVIIFYVAILFMILPALGVFLYFSLDKIIYNSVDLSLLSSAKALATLVSNENGQTEFIFSDEIMWEYDSIKAKNFFQLRRVDGTIIEKSRSLKNFELPSPHDLSQISYQDISLKGRSARLVNFRFTGSDIGEHKKAYRIQPHAADFIIQCAVDIDEQADLLENYRLILFLSIILIMIISAAGGFFIAQKALSPIKEISDTIQGVSESNLSERINYRQVPREMQGLAISFNHTFERLEKSFKRQKQFVGDASHELRTPLSVILSQSEIMLRNKRSAEEYKNALVTIKETAEMMSKIVEKLLALARLNSNEVELKMEPLNLNDVIHQAVRAVVPIADIDGIRINFPGYGHPVISGNWSALVELVVNIFENAIKYNSLEGRIDISVKKKGLFFILKVQDSGIGISPEDIDKVFDRFYRADTSRSKKVGGIGLGLSICKEIANRHGGRIKIESTVGVGTTVSISLKENLNINPY